MTASPQPSTRVALLSTLLAVTLLAAPLALAADTPTETNGLDKETVAKLWSNDEDTDESFEDINATNQSEGTVKLLQQTDWVFERPPQAAKTWNTRDQQNYTHGGVSISVYPQAATPQDSQFIKDAYVETYTVSPSTVVHANDSRTYRRISSSGKVSSVLDYRVEIPEDKTSGDRRVYWSLENATISSVVLTSDGISQSTAQQTYTPVLSYQQARGQTELQTTATITVSIEKTVEVRKEDCDQQEVETENGTETRTVCQTYWDETTTSESDQMTVSDTITGTVSQPQIDIRSSYQPTATGSETIYHIDSSGPWKTVELPSGTTIHSPWRFYTEADTDWRKMTASSASQNNTFNATTRPVTTHAFPSTYDMRSVGGRTELIDTETTNRTAPTLPSYITVSVAERNYTQLNEATIKARNEPNDGVISVSSFVRGDTQSTFVASTEVTPTNTTARIVNKTNTEITIHTNVTEAETGAPVTNGAVVIGDERVSLDNNGAANTTVARPNTDLKVQYMPENWWENTDTAAYSGSETYISFTPAFPTFSELIQYTVATLIWLIPLLGGIYALNIISDGAIYTRGDD